MPQTAFIFPIFEIVGRVSHERPPVWSLREPKPSGVGLSRAGVLGRDAGMSKAKPLG
jgi:hypothetical protein